MAGAAADAATGVSHSRQTSERHRLCRHARHDPRLDDARAASWANGGAVMTPRYRPLGQLILARLREFYREPEAVFWVYGFPILMVVLLGIAFRNKPVEQVRVDLIKDPLAEETKNALAKGAPEKTFVAEINDDETAHLRLRTGKTDLIVRATAGTDRRSSSASAAPAHYEFSFDPSRPESVLARDTVNDALQRAAGRNDIAVVSDKLGEETGSRYI